MNYTIIGVDSASGKDETTYGFTNWLDRLNISIEYPPVTLLISKDWEKFLDKEESDTPIIVEAK